MLSMGCASLSTHKSNIVDLTSSIAPDSELVDVELAWRIGRSGVYYRLSSVQHVQSMRNASSTSVESIIASTKRFLAYPDVVEKVNQTVDASRRQGGVTLAEISGLSERKPAAAHGLPSLSAFFVERPALIKIMAGYLLQSGPPAQRTIVLSGLGGIGKTQITVSFLLHFLAIFRHVLFIDGSSVQTIESGLVAKVKSLGAAYSRTTAKEALDVLENPDHEITRDWAIVYDNVDDPSIRIAGYFPKCAFGTIFITTRNPKLGNLSPNTHLRLDTMPEEEAVEVLLKSAIQPPRAPTDEEEKHAREIAKELGYLPVALVQAGYFIQLHGCMGDYSRRLRKRRPDILKRPAEHQRDEHYHGVYATLEVTWPYLSDRAWNYMSILGFVNYTGFPLILIGRAVLHGFLFEPFAFMSRPDTFQQTVQLLCRTFMPQEEWDEQDIDDLVDELERYSLVTRMSTFMVNTLRLHPLVHSWVHDRLSNTEKQLYQAAAVRLMVCGTGDDNEDIFEFVYPHVTSWSMRFELMHPNDSGGLAGIYAHQGDHTTAIAIWERIFKKISKKHGADDLRSGEAKLQLAASYRKHKASANLTAAAKMEREVVQQYTRTLGPEIPVTIRALMQQARGMAQWNQREEAIAILRSVLSFWQGQHHEDRDSILQAKEALAFALFRQSAQEHALFKQRESNIVEVMQIYTEILQNRMTHEGNHHHATVKATEDLAVVYERYTNYRWGEDRPAIDGNAVELWISAVNARTKRWGTHHPDTLDAMERLALSYYFQGDHKTFVENWTHLFVLRRNAQCVNHEKVVEMKKRLVDMQSTCSNHAEGHLLRTGVICLMNTIHGCAHKDTVEVVQKFARECGGWSQYEEAIGWWKEGLALLKKIQGLLNNDTISALEKLANNCERWGKYEESIIQRKELLASREKLQGIDHYTLSVMERLAITYHMCGQHSMAITQWKDVIAQIKELHGHAHVATIEAMERFAKNCELWQQYEEAVAQRKNILVLRKDIQGSHHAETLEALENLATSYELSERYDEATVQWKELLTLKKESQKIINEDTLICMVNVARVCGRYGQWNDSITQIQELHWRAHKQTSKAIETFARDCAQRSEYDEAVVQWKGILASQKDIQGTKHEDSLKFMKCLAWQCVHCAQNGGGFGQWMRFIAQTKELHGSAYKDTAEAMERFARECEEWSQYAGAMRWWKKSLALRKEIQGPRHEEILNCMENLASACELSGQLNEAIARREKIIALGKEIQGPGHDDIINCMEKLATTHEYLRHFEAALELRKEVVALRKEIQGPGHDGTLNCMEKLATTFEYFQEVKKALVLRKEVLALREEIQGINHEVTLACLKLLARTYHMSGQHEMAIIQWKNLITRTKELHGHAHINTMEVMERFVENCERWKQYEEAVAQRNNILILRKDIQGFHHAETLEPLEKVANARELSEQCDETIVRRKEALALQQEVQGPRHEDTISALKRFSYDCEEWGRYEDVVWARKELMTVRKRIPWLSREDLFNEMQALARSCEHWGLYDEAIQQWKEILDLQEEIPGATYEDTFKFVKSLVWTYIHYDQHGAAISQWKDFVAQSKEFHGGAYENTIEAIERFARECEGWPPHEAAIEWWKESLALRRKFRGPQHEDTLNCMENLATAYEISGQYEEAIVLRREALALREVTQGTNHKDTLFCMESLAWTYHMSGQHEMAFVQWKDVIVRTKELHGNAHEDTVGTMERFAGACGQWKQHQEAQVQWEGTLVLLKETRGSRYEDTLTAMEMCAAACENLGEYEAALAQRKMLLASRKEIQGTNHGDTVRCMQSLAWTYERLHLYEEAEAQWKEMIPLTKTMGLCWDAPLPRRSLANLYRKLGRNEKLELLLIDASDEEEEETEFNYLRDCELADESAIPNILEL